MKTKRNETKRNDYAKRPDILLPITPSGIKKHPLLET